MTEKFLIYSVMIAEQVVDYTVFRYVIHIPQLKMLNSVFLHQLQCCAFSYAAEHFTELLEINYVGIG